MANPIEVNKYQTQVTDELLKTYPSEVVDSFFDCVNNIDFIHSLISPNRKYAKDLDRDYQGRIIVDIAHPHILEDMDYFRPSMLHFKKYGTYTDLKPNSNPNSEFSKWLKEEVRRCWEGYVRPSDGEWVTGPLYFYLNYVRIRLSKVRKGSKVADKVVDFPEIWEGIYLRFHYIDQARNGGMYDGFTGGKHGAELAARGKSKSYSMASILAHNFILGENGTASREVLSLVLAFHSQYLDKDGILNKFLSIIDFLAENTQFPRRRLKSSLGDMDWKLGYKDAELGTERGLKNEVIGVSIENDPEKPRGKRAVFIGVEEFGSFPNLINVYNICTESVQEGSYSFGIMYLQGTAGDDKSDFEGAQEIMYHPNGYNMYCLPNVYDKVNCGRPDFVYFFPSYLNRKGCYNENGVSDVVKALFEVLMRRYITKYNSDNPATIVKVVTEQPITPSEAIIKNNGSRFPITDLSERLLQIDSKPNYYSDVYTGDLAFSTSGELKYVPSSEPPIRDFPHQNNKMIGCIEFYNMPEKDSNGKVMSGRYVLSCDPYDDDSSTTLSLGSVFVLDLWKDTIVAEYTGRPHFVDTFYENTRRLCLFYNGVLNYENNKKGLFAYFSKMNSLYLLSDTLSFLKDRDLIKDVGYGNKAKGTCASAPINDYARRLLYNWLVLPVTITNTDGDITTLNLYRLRTRAFIKELISWNSEGNFDRVSSAGMLMLIREARMILYGGNMNKASEVKPSDYLGNDNFFKSNYDDKFSKTKDKLYNKFNYTVDVLKEKELIIR